MADTEEFEGSIFPVFVTADLPHEVINDILKRCHDYTKADDPDDLEGLALVESLTTYNPSSPQPGPIPATFSSPFLNKTVSELSTIFEQHIAPGHDEEDTPKASHVFAVLDERSGRDRTVLLVSLLDHEDGEEPDQMRAEAEVTALLGLAPEMAEAGLSEGKREEGVGADGVLVYTRERYERMMAEGSHLEGDDDDGDEEDDE